MCVQSLCITILHCITYIILYSTIQNIETIESDVNFHAPDCFVMQTSSSMTKNRFNVLNRTIHYIIIVILSVSMSERQLLLISSFFGKKLRISATTEQQGPGPSTEPEPQPEATTISPIPPQPYYS